MPLSWNDADIVFFDMDHTLIHNDCDVSWKEFLIDAGIAPGDERIEAQRHYEDYCAGQLDEETFLWFQTRQFIGKTLEEMRALSQRHFEERVRHRIYPRARQAVAATLERGVPVAILSSTNTVVAEPIAEALGIPKTICTELELRDGVFTGRIVPPYCFRAGKIPHAQAYCDSLGKSLDRAAYFGDSTNDIPMLEVVGAPVTINPTGVLLAKAQEMGWVIEKWTLED
jgi:HAD superfamily hydrolase (TIGR01490 family)